MKPTVFSFRHVVMSIACTRKQEWIGIEIPRDISTRASAIARLGTVRGRRWRDEIHF